MTTTTRTGHTTDCLTRAVAVLALSGDFASGTTGRQQDAAALDALTTGDVECICPLCDECDAAPGAGCEPWCTAAHAAANDAEDGE